MRKRYNRYYDSDDNNWYPSDNDPVEYDDNGKIFSIGGKEIEYDYSGKISSIGGEEVYYDSDEMITGWGDTEIDFMENLHPYNRNNSTHNDRDNKIVNEKDYYWGDSEVEYGYHDEMISNWGDVIEIDYMKNIPPYSRNNSKNSTNNDRYNKIFNEKDYYWGDREVEYDSYDEMISNWGDIEIDYMENTPPYSRNNSNNSIYNDRDNKIVNENDCFSKNTHITKKGKKKKHKKHLFSNKSYQSDSHSKDSDTSDYDYYYDNSSIRDLNDYSKYDSTGVNVENAEYEGGRMTSICGKDIEYEDDKMYKIGGEFVNYDDDGHMSSIGGDDANYGSDGNFSGWGSENIEYKDNNPYL